MAKARGAVIANLQQLRKEIKGLERTSGKNIFDTQYMTDDWAFHRGGRTEIQFNIGIEDNDLCRYGIAFSLEPSRTVPDISVLFPKIDRFNEWIRQNEDSVSDLEMWHYDAGRKSDDYPPSRILDRLKRKDVFVFLGKRMPTSEALGDAAPIVALLDRLIPLYRYVEAAEDEQRFDAMPHGVRFKEGCPPRPSRTLAQVSGGTRSVCLRHNDLQIWLHDHLKTQYPGAKVGVEAKTPTGSIDVFVEKTDGRRDYYEIKTAGSAQACLREAIPQLLEYAYWPGSEEAETLFIAGEPALDARAAQYLEALKEKFSLPLAYYRIVR